jgi:hypothetical protein
MIQPMGVRPSSWVNCPVLMTSSVEAAGEGRRNAGRDGHGQQDEARVERGAAAHRLQINGQQELGAEQRDHRDVADQTGEEEGSPPVQSQIEQRLARDEQLDQYEPDQTRRPDAEPQQHGG